LSEPAPERDEARRTPQEKKQLSYSKDRRNTYGENAKSSRKAIPKAKQRVNRANRRIVRQGMTRAAAQPANDEIEVIVSDTLGKRRKRWKKWPDQPLGEVLPTKLENRAREGLAEAPAIKAAIERVRAHSRKR
jgi:hypothetical protein